MSTDTITSGSTVREEQVRRPGPRPALEGPGVREALSVLDTALRSDRRPPVAPDTDRGNGVRELYRSAPPMRGERISTGLPIGERAPDFVLHDAQDQPVGLADFRGRPVVLVFYPLDWSPGCSRQLELYQQELDEFTGRGVQLVGISVDSIYSHGAWAAVRGISFPLLADFAPRGEVARRYRVWRERDGFSERALYLLDADGVIRYAHVSPYLHHLPDFDELLRAMDGVTSREEARAS